MTGLEPATSGVTGRRSNQLSYIRMGLRAGDGARRGEGRAIGGAPVRVKRTAALRKSSGARLSCYGRAG